MFQLGQNSVFSSFSAPNKTFHVIRALSLIRALLFVIGREDTFSKSLGLRDE